LPPRQADAPTTLAAAIVATLGTPLARSLADPTEADPMIFSTLRHLQRLDRSREGIPGEHWAAFGAGLTLLGWAGRAPSSWLRAAAGAAGVLLVVRAASGRDGLWSRLRRESATPRLSAPEDSGAEAGIR